MGTAHTGSCDMRAGGSSLAPHLNRFQPSAIVKGAGFHSVLKFSAHCLTDEGLAGRRPEKFDIQVWPTIEAIIRRFCCCCCRRRRRRRRCRRGGPRFTRRLVAITSPCKRMVGWLVNSTLWAAAAILDATGIPTPSARAKACSCRCAWSLLLSFLVKSSRF